MKSINRKQILLSCIILCASAVKAQTWLPRLDDAKETFRALSCQYDGAKLKEIHTVTPASQDWTVKIDRISLVGGEATDYIFTFTARRAMHDSGVAVAFDQRGWSSDNYVMIPAVVYNGNRQRIVNRQYATGLDQTDYFRPDLALTSNPIPQLSPEFGAKSRLEVNVSNTTTPAITYLDRRAGKAVLLFTDQGITYGNEIKDHALIVEEASDRSLATFVVSAPGVREQKPEFIGFSPSPDRGIQVKVGDEIRIHVTRIETPCTNVPSLLSRFMQERKKHTVEETPRNLMPMSEVAARMQRNIEERYYTNDKWEFYCPENANWMSYGWVGGLINTYPMLALNDDLHLNRVKHTFDFSLQQGYGKSGFFYDLIDENGKVIERDAAKLHPGIGLTRKNADILYWMVKQFMLMKQQGNTARISPKWEKSVRCLAEAFATTWWKEGTWGNYLDMETGRVAVYNTTSGAMAVGGMALAARYFGEPRFLEIARSAAADFYKQFALVGFTSGGCGDILQNADSETAAAMMTSMMVLYEETGDTKYLKQSVDLANLCATWTISFPYRLPGNTALAKLGANLTGAVWASTQNKHGAPGFCTQSGDALFKIYRATGDTLYADLMRDIIHAHAEGVQPNGKITERLTYCDADSRGSRGDGGKTGWNETNGALMALEIPGIYVRKDLGKAYVFDHVEVKKMERTASGMKMSLYNPTQFEATVTIFAEDATQASRPLGENGFLNWKQKVRVKAGKTATIRIK